MKNSLLQIQQLNSKMLIYSKLGAVVPPPTGWIYAIRTSLGMSMQQLGKKLSVSKQAVNKLEINEKEGTINVKSLKEAANALDMEFVYGFIPKDGSLHALIEKKAKELATQIVLRTSNTMKLEDQENKQVRIQKAIEERTAEIINQMPKILWD